MPKGSAPAPFRIRVPTLQDPTWQVLARKHWQRCTDFRLYAPVINDPKTQELTGVGVVRCVRRGVIEIRS